MRYLYHKSGSNVGPVSFEELQALAAAGTIDGMTPVLAEGSKAWSRWLFIKDAPQNTPAPEPVLPKKEEPKPVITELPRPKTEVKEKETAIADSKPEEKHETSAEQKAEITALPAEALKDENSRPAPLLTNVNPLWIIDGAAVVVALVCIVLCGLWHTEARDMAQKTEQLHQACEQQVAGRTDIRTMEEQLQTTNAQAAETKAALETDTAKAEELKKELNKLGSPETGTGDLDEKLNTLRGKVKELDQKAAELNKQR